MKPPYFRLSLLLLPLTMALAACSSDETDSAAEAGSTRQAAASGTVSPLLQYIPHDTPYVFANTRNNPALLDLTWKFGDSALAELQGQIEQQDLGELENPLLQAVVQELNGRLNRAGLAELGLDLNGNLAFYGNGLLPVARIGLKDPTKLDATVRRIEDKSGHHFPRGQIGDLEYLYMAQEPGDPAVFAAMTEDQLVLAIGPAGVDEAGLSSLLGLVKPDRNIADSGRIDAVNDEYNFLPYGTLIVDSALLVDRVFNDDSVLASEAFAEIRANASPVCLDELNGMAAVMPRVISGYTELNEQRLRGTGAIELRQDIASAMASIVHPLAGLGPQQDSMLYFGMGVNLLQARAFAMERLQAIAAAPYQCEWFAKLNEAAQEAAQSANQPLPPMVGNVQGFRLSLDHLELAGGMPGNIRGKVMIGMSNPELLLGLAQSGFLPQLSELEINSDGEPVALPDGLIPFVQTPHIAMMSHGFGLSVGPGTETQLKAFLDQPVMDDPPLIALGYSGEFLKMYTNQLQTMMAAFGQSGGGMPSYEDVVDRLHATIALTQRGIEFDSVTVLLPTQQ